MLTSVRGILDHVILDQAVLAADTDAIRPLLEGVCSAWANVVVLHSSVGAGERALGEVEA